jgi:pyruvate kinase
MRHTKIVATVGPASNSAEAIEALIRAGVDVFRLNFSHGTHEAHAAVAKRVRAAATRLGCHVGIMQDLSGPKIRTGPLASDRPIALEEGKQLELRAGDAPTTDAVIYTPYAELIRSARPGDRLLLDDGRIELRIVERGAEALRAVVVNGGPLGGHKGINAPGVPLPASAVTSKDAADLRFGLELGVDFVALSFVQTAEDVLRARDIMSSAGATVPLIAKIERPSGVEHLDAILEHADAVMVARGDLGLEMPLEQVPRIQKEIIARARELGRPAILATQVLESMRVEPRPTRAEVSDAAKAVDEGADAIMLAGETAVGSFPIRAVQTLDAVIRDAESVPSTGRIALAVDPTGSRHGRAICEAAITLATAGAADAIVAVTSHGRTARLLGSLRPAAPVIAATPDPQLANALSIVRGVHPLLTPQQDVMALAEQLLERKLVRPGSVVVFVNVGPDLERVDGNFVTVQRVGG